MRKTLLIPLFLCFFLLTINPVKADNPNLLDFPTQLGLKLGISSFAAGLLLSALLLMVFLLPLNIMIRASGWLNITIGFIIAGACVAIQWLPAWVMLGIVLAIAGLFAFRIGRILK